MLLENSLYKKTIQLTDSDNQTNIVIPFRVEELYQYLEIDVSYTPQEVSERIAKGKILSALPKYHVNLENWNDFLPLLNLITVSVSHNDSYIGCRHTKESVQKIIISEDASSLGFINYGIVQGSWELQLNLHCICSDVEVQLQVKGVKNEVLFK